MPDPLVVDAAMQTILDTHLDAHTRDLTAAWVQAWRDVRAELDAAVLGQVAAGNVADAVPIDPARLRSALDIVEARLAEVADETGRVITSSTDPVVRLGVDGEATMTRAVTPDGVTVHRADAGQISAIIDRTTTSTLTATDDLAPETLDVVRRRLVRGVTVGDSPRLVADQILADTEQGFLGGLTRALNISRTEMLTAMRTAQWATDQANKDVLRGWRWTCHADSRTCRSCLALDGTEYPVEEEGPDDHHSGRCARVPLTKSWAELGFQGVPETAVDFPDTGEWFESQDEATQRSILTPRGYDAWKRGDYPMSAWAVRRENPGWRATMVPSKPPK